MEFYLQLRYYPFLRILIPYISGILFSFLFQIDIFPLFILFLFFLFLILVFIRFYKVYRSRYLFGSFLHAVLIIAGMLHVRVILSPLENINLSAENEIYFKALVIESPEEKEKSLKTVIRVLETDENFRFLKNCKVLTYVKDKSYNIKAGDVLLIKSCLQKIEGPKNPYELDYRKIMLYKKIVLRTYLDTYDFKKAGARSNIRIWAVNARNKIQENYKKAGVTGNELGVLSALTIGDTDEIPDELTRAYSETGIVHILSVSGLHVGIIYKVLNYLLGFLNRTRKGQIIKITVIILFLWMFALIAGFKASAVRASLMFSLLQIGNSVQRPSEIYNTISVSAFFILLINPLQITQIGFQLSYLAVLGIVTFQKSIYNVFISKNRILDTLWLLLSVSLAAQISTTPVILLYFHQFPTYFWLTNIIAIPLTGLITYGGTMLTILAPLNLSLAKIFAFIPVFLIKIMNKAIELIQDLPLATIFNINITSTEAILFYSFIFFISCFLLYRRIIFFKYFLIFVLVFMVNGIYKDFRYSSQNKLTIYSVPGKTAISLFKGKKAIMICSADSKNTGFYLSNHLLRHGVSGNIEEIKIGSNEKNTSDNDLFFSQNCGGNLFFSVSGFRGLLLTNKMPGAKPADCKIKLDCIILSNNVPINFNDLSKLFEFEKIILDSSNTRWYISLWKKYDMPEGVELIVINDKKAYELNL